MVLTLAAILMAIALPAMGRLIRRDSAGALATDVAQVFARARAQASASGAPSAVTYDALRRTLCVEARIDTDKVYGRWTPVPGPGLSLTLPADAHLEWPVQAPPGQEGLAEGGGVSPTSGGGAIGPARVGAAGAAGSAGTAGSVGAGSSPPGAPAGPRLVFSPRLSSDGADLTLTAGGENVRVHVDPITGRASVRLVGQVSP